VRGDVALDIALGGSVAAPNFGGEVVLAGGRFESPATGLDLRNVTARLVGDGSTLRVAQLSGATPNGGTLGGSGSIRLAPGEPVADLRLTGRNALLARTDLADVTGDLDIAVRGPVSTAAITGAVNLDQVNIRVPETLPPQVVDLPVRERGKPRPVAKDSAAAAAGDAAAGGPTLDVRVVADNRIYIRGRGINAEFSGALTVRGDVGSPRPEGGISLRRGTLDLLGQRLTFTRGEITLTGGREIDPVLDLIASATGADVTVQANVTGRVSAPDVALSSQPPLPQDEILARLLFGEAVAELSPAQAIQVAQIAAQLAGFGGGGEGLLGNLRDALGVDRLDVTGIGESGGGGVGLSAGRYLSDNVYVGVEQGLGSGETRAKVEIEVSPSITVETDFGNTGQSRAGVKYRIDY
ncbi:MAG TPA: translocation/assembly module TamB domain-containing protein, partial [Alphaproteobacteria bacterium]|nr:translocation/assembly module TamB domain-containing protein [Alphaproteobacteria bacterium]